MFKSEVELADEFATIKEITPKDLKMKNFFGMNRNYFIQVDPNGGQMHNHYYHIKKQCRKKSQPLYAFKLNPDVDYAAEDL